MLEPYAVTAEDSGLNFTGDRGTCVGCQILADSAVNEYLNQIRVIMTNECNADRIAFYREPLSCSAP